MFESITSISHFVFYYSQNRLCCVFYVCVCEPGTDVRPDVTQCDTHAQHSRGTHSFAADAFLIRDTETNNAAAAAGAAVSVAGFVVHIRCDDASLCVSFTLGNSGRPGPGWRRWRRRCALFARSHARTIAVHRPVVGSSPVCVCLSCVRVARGMHTSLRDMLCIR